jgi:hypothetical protein
MALGSPSPALVIKRTRPPAISSRPENAIGETVPEVGLEWTVRAAQDAEAPRSRERWFRQSSRQRSVQVEAG